MSAFDWLHITHSFKDIISIKKYIKKGRFQHVCIITTKTKKKQQKKTLLPMLLHRQLKLQLQLQCRSPLLLLVLSLIANLSPKKCLAYPAYPYPYPYPDEVLPQSAMLPADQYHTISSPSSAYDNDTSTATTTSTTSTTTISTDHVIGHTRVTLSYSYAVYNDPLSGEPTGPEKSYENKCSRLGTHLSYPQPGFWGEKVLIHT